METFTVPTSRQQEFINITHEVKSVVRRSQVTDGEVVVFVPHTTAGITINENADPDVVLDIIATLEELIPVRGEYHHSEGNSHAHIKASLLGSSVRVIVANGDLVLGTWQGIFFCEFDGPRSRKVHVEVISRKL
jgi:secondary thiamine-phosphate synthase enzyme